MLSDAAGRSATIADMRIVLAATLAIALGAAAQAAENLSTGEVVDRTTLRVCADPADLPFSNEAGEGFENAVASLMAAHMDRPLTYVWYPRTIGFVRQTLRARLCDLVMGVVSANELMQNTNPYYRSTYVMAVREADAERLPELASPAAKDATIGVVAGTPPANILASLGLLANVRPYQLRNDSRANQPLRQMVNDLASGEIDIALGWGPPVGYFAARSGEAIHLTALKSDDKRLRTDFRISMGVRWGEPDWKHEINEVIAELQPEITKILQRYDVPLLDDDGNLISGVAQVTVDKESLVARTSQSAAEPAGPVVEEPEGYRMERYRAPVPATLTGGTVLDTAALRAMLETDAPILIDVKPKQRKPPGRDDSMPWMQKKRQNIPGSVWLPNTGFGDLSPEFAEYLMTNLDDLSAGDKSKALVFYCDMNCWMSYNAAKRTIHELGYSNVYWYPEGADGWQAAGFELVEAEEIAMPDFVR